MKKNIILLGSPGAGKGTIAQRFVKDNEYTLITTGDILREERKSGSKLGNEINEIINSGKLVSDEIMNQIVENKIKSSKAPFLLDGYPRTVAQAKFLSKLVNIDTVVYLEVTDDVVIERILKRSETSGREDDKDVKIINKRLEAFKAETQPLVDFYSEPNDFYPEGKNLLSTIDAENPQDEVYSDFSEIVLSNNKDKEAELG